MHRFLTASAALVAVAALAAAPSFAATATHPAKTNAVVATAPVTATPRVTFKTIDANHDGKISYAELLKFYPHTTKAEFAKFAKAGFLNHAELAAFAKAEQVASLKK